MTDLCQPVDCKVAAETKKINHALHVVEKQENREKWRDYRKNGSLGASQRRMYMAKWLDTTWKFLKSHRRQLLDRAWDKTVLIQLDGTHSLELNGLENYQPPPPPVVCVRVCMQLAVSDYTTLELISVHAGVGNGDGGSAKVKTEIEHGSRRTCTVEQNTKINTHPDASESLSSSMPSSAYNTNAPTK